MIIKLRHFPTDELGLTHTMHLQNRAKIPSAEYRNYFRARVPLPALAAGKHTFRIRAIDPGAVVDRAWLS